MLLHSLKNFMGLILMRIIEELSQQLVGPYDNHLNEMDAVDCVVFHPKDGNQNFQNFQH